MRASWSTNSPGSSADRAGGVIDSQRPRARQWLASDFTELTDGASFDVVIIGSGYGGSMAAHHLAGLERDGKPLSIALLERGREYVEGEFPAETGDLPLHTRIAGAGSPEPRGNLAGLFDVRVGGDVSALVGSGLGGTSLINAGVMLRPAPDVLATGWPESMRPDTLDPHFDACETLLGAAARTSLPPKYHALRQLDPANTRPASITIAEAETERFDACNGCGNCATGCNFGARKSLDVMLLAEAKRTSAAFSCFTGAAVQHIRRGPGGDRRWRVEVRPTARGLSRRYSRPVTIGARYVVVAAGTFGSTELLMRSASADLAFSPMLGRSFSANGDALAFVHAGATTVQALASGAAPASSRWAPKMAATSRPCCAARRPRSATSP